MYDDIINDNECVILDFSINFGKEYDMKCSKFSKIFVQASEIPVTKFFFQHLFKYL